MTDREAGRALIASEPELKWRRHDGRWRVRHKSVRRWDRWNRRRIAAMIHFGYRP